MAKTWLKCSVSNGMFTNERMIAVNVLGNGRIEEFVPTDTVRGSGDSARVAVDAFKRNNRHWAVLPTPYRRTIPVEEGELVTA